MKKTLLASAALIALGTTDPLAMGHGSLVFAPGEDARMNWDSWEAYEASAPDLSDQELTMFGPWLGLDCELVQSVPAYFDVATGTDVQYSGSDSFEQQIRIDAQAGSATNVAVFPQPGLLGDLARAGLVVPLTDGDADWIRDKYAAGQSWIDLATFDDSL